ncbi:ABC transporter permease [Saccharothrix sp. ST-888]|uniref:ABC transporter permease n=1 Tax=Saccharothrix sp. ST-888 TaxID=1427391 RepID=UPI0018CC862B|nr:ABC transporter permease subunit [Saccharothrix sp. ST-888]
MASLISKIRFGRGLVLLVCGVYFAVPMAASVIFSIDDSKGGTTFRAYTDLLNAPGFMDSLTLSLELAGVTVAVLLLLLVPALLAARLGAPKLRPVIEVICSLPLVVPVVALTTGIVGVLRWGPDYLSDTPLFQTIVAIQDPSFPIVLVIAYVLMALPFAYRALDAGLRGVDVVTLVEAARNCGAGWARAVFTVVLPNLRSALLNAAVLTVALVLGEFTTASILGFAPFSVWISSNGKSDGQMSVAVSILSLLIVWVVLLLMSAVGRGRKSARS